MARADVEMAVVPAEAPFAQDHESANSEGSSLPAPDDEDTNLLLAGDDAGSDTGEGVGAVVVVQMPRSHGLFGWFLLLLLATNTTAGVISRRYSALQHDKFNKSSVLLAAEVLKLVVSATAMGLGMGRNGGRPVTLRVLFSTSFPMAVVSGIFVAQNFLSYLTLFYIDSGTFSLILQGKILSTALLARVWLGKALSGAQWRALAQLLVGVVIICAAGLEAAQHAAGSAESRHRSANAFLQGTAMSVVLLLLSGFSTVFMEGVLKKHTQRDAAEEVTVWERNVQLATISVLQYIPFIAMEGSLASAFAEWNWHAVVVAVTSALAGILVALCLKYTDSVMKQMSSTVAIVMTVLVEWRFLGGAMSLNIVCGALVVLLAVANYTA